MAAGRIVLPGWMPARTPNGTPIGDAEVYVYDNLTTTLATVWANEALTTPLANPVSANSSGQFPAIWAEGGTDISPVLYTVAITADDGGTSGRPSTFDNLRPSVDAETATLILTESAADSAETALQEIEDIAANAPDAPSVVNKANRDGGNALLTFARNAPFELESAEAVAEQTLSDKLGQSVCVDDFDRGDGDTAMFNRAIAHAQDQGAAGCIIKGKNGRSYTITGTVTVPTGPRVVFEMYGSRIFVSTTNQPVFVLGAWGAEFHGGEFYANVTQVSGSIYINLNGEYTRADGVRFSGDFTSVRMSGVNCRLTNCLWDAGAENGRRVHITGGDVSHMINGFLFNAQSAPFPECGFYIDNSAAPTIVNGSIISQGTCILVAPGTGQAVASIKMSNLFLDSAENGVVMAPTGTGTIVRTKMTDVWMSSHSGYGFQAIAPTGTLIDGVEMTNCELQLNAQDAILFSGPGAKNLRVSGGSMAGNTGAAISIGPDATGVMAYGFRAGPCDGITTPNGTGLFLDPDAEYEIFDCDVRGNTNNAIGYDTPGPTQILRNVRGVVQTARGTATIPIGGAAVAFDPGLDVTITSRTGFRIAWTSSLAASGITSYFVPSFTATTYTIQVSGGLVAGTAFDIGWEVDVTPIPSS